MQFCSPAVLVQCIHNTYDFVIDSMRDIRFEVVGVSMENNIIRLSPKNGLYMVDHVIRCCTWKGFDEHSVVFVRHFAAFTFYNDHVTYDHSRRSSWHFIGFVFSRMGAFIVWLIVPFD